MQGLAATAARPLWLRGLDQALAGKQVVNARAGQPPLQWRRVGQRAPGRTRRALVGGVLGVLPEIRRLFAQTSLAQEDESLPDFQRFGTNAAFVEGWALYAETLGFEMGLYDDPLQHWGTLDDEMLRAMRLVVDTGIHAQGWSRDQAIGYMLANSGMGRSDVEAEVDRYIANPAQALSYKIGALTIQRLRREGEATLGARFDLRAFHEQVLGSGVLPLPVLEDKVRRWIASRREACCNTTIN